MLPPSVQRAFSINPAPGTTFLDAEHVVILMQENRSFDHTFGTLQGVRGFNDPRAIKLPNGNPVWMQTNKQGETHIPFRMNIKDTNATWMGALPHGWTDQTDTHNEGRHDRWLDAKKSGNQAYKNIPLTLGHYTRADIPFYYSLADAFTVCDQNFCSALTGTTANRSFLWSGCIHDHADPASIPRVRNEELSYSKEGQWKTFPERLEDNDVSWKVYQNEISLDSGLDDDEDSWLANFTDNPLEWFTQYHVRFHPASIAHMPLKIKKLSEVITDLEKQLVGATGNEAEALTKYLSQRRAQLSLLKEEQQKYTAENFNRLPENEKNLHRKAFSNNINDPSYRKLDTLKYDDAGVEREMKVPKGDVLHQFRTDVQRGNLPTVSWLVAPANFSDHPGAPWYGAWYLSESLDILTRNPEVWKKTIFILCYDENDGYFDHVPPFVPPDLSKQGTGLSSMDTKNEFLTLAQDLTRKGSEQARGGPIGLGYRVPLIVASPWTRGGNVCSQVFDHTSILMFLEKFLQHKTGKEIRESNISEWRRTVCGDLTSVFRPYAGEKMELPSSLKRDTVLEGIHKAQFKSMPGPADPLSDSEIKAGIDGILPRMLRQEQGTRPSRAIPYELYADGKLQNKDTFELTLKAGNQFFGKRAVGSPFTVYRRGPNFRIWNYTAKPGESLVDKLPLDNELCYFEVYGPNGFFRSFAGQSWLEVNLEYDINQEKQLTGNLLIHARNKSNTACPIAIRDRSYHAALRKDIIPANRMITIPVELTKSNSWYDLEIQTEKLHGFKIIYAGKVETGRDGYTDPAMA